MTFRGGEGSVHGSIAKPEVPGLTLLPAFTADVIHSPVSVIISGVTLGHLRLAAVLHDELVVVVVGGIIHVFGAVPDDLVIPVPAEPVISSCMPFPDMCSGVAVFTKDTRPETTLLWVVNASGVLPFHPHGFDSMLLKPGQQRGS